MITTALTVTQFGTGDGATVAFPIIADSAVDFSGSPQILKNGNAQTPVTDYAFDAAGFVTFAAAPQVGDVLAWDGAISYTLAEPAYALAHKTIVGQYHNSLTLKQLIESFSDYIDPSADFDAFISMIWNIDTAQGFGLDILGRIVNLSRTVDVPAIYPVMVAPGLRDMPDDQYRIMLRAKALTNISAVSAPGINAVLKLIANGRGNAFCRNLGNMHMQYRFLFALSAIEYGIMAQDQAVPHPAGVQIDIVSIQPYFGFNEAGSWGTFGEAVFADY